MQQFIHPRSIPPGTVVAVPVRVGPMTIMHPGLSTEQLGPDGLPTVISASKRRARRVVEEAWSSFTDGQVASIQEMASTVSVPEMLYRARADLGKRWDLLSSNCEHAVRQWRGLPKDSPQLRYYTLAAGVVALIAILALGRR